MLSETIQITAMPDNQLAAIWKGIEHQDGTYAEGIFVGLWDGIGWRVLGDSLIVPTVELGEGHIRWRNNFHLTVSPDDKLYLVWGSEVDGEREVNMKVWDGWKWETVESNLGQFVVVGWESPYMAAAQDGVLYLVWSQVYNNDREIYLVKWDGKQWMEVSPGSASERGISQSYSWSENPRLAVAADGALYVSWQTADRHRIKHWDGTRWTEIEKSVLTDNGTSGHYSEIAIIADQIYATWSSDRSVNRQIYVQQWDGVQWIDVGYDMGKYESVSQNRSSSYSQQIAAVEGKICVAWADDSPSALLVRPYLQWNQWPRRPHFSLLEYERKYSVYARCYSN